MYIARSIGRTIGRGIGRLDPDAQDYFTRAEALGGSFDLTSIDAAYTETYVKGAIIDYVVGLKADGLWDKLTELYLLSGVTFGGLMAKLKHAGTATLTNNNFVTGDYVAAGTSAGLKGDGGTKYLDTGVNEADNVLNSLSISAYRTEVPVGTPRVDIGSLASHIGNGTSNELFVRMQNTNFAVTQSATGNLLRHYLASRTDSSSIMIYMNGVLTITGSAASTTLSSFLFFLFCRYPGNALTNARLSFAHIGTGLTDTDAVKLSTRTNALMTALGTNVY